MEQPAGYIDATENGQKKFLTAPQVYSMPGRVTTIKPQRERLSVFKISGRQRERKQKLLKFIGFSCHFERTQPTRKKHEKPVWKNAPSLRVMWYHSFLGAKPFPGLSPRQGRWNSIWASQTALFRKFRPFVASGPNLSISTTFSKTHKQTRDLHFWIGLDLV